MDGWIAIPPAKARPPSVIISAAGKPKSVTTMTVIPAATASATVDPAVLLQ